MWDNIWSTIKCFFDYHKQFKSIQVLRPQGSERIKCVHCGKEFVYNYNLRVMIPWDSGLEKFYRSVGNEIINPKFINLPM